MTVGGGQLVGGYQVCERAAGRQIYGKLLRTAKEEGEPEQRDVPEPGILRAVTAPGCCAGRDQDGVDLRGAAKPGSTSSTNRASGGKHRLLPKPRPSPVCDPAWHTSTWWTGDRCASSIPTKPDLRYSIGPAGSSSGGSGDLEQAKDSSRVTDGIAVCDPVTGVGEDSCGAAPGDIAVIARRAGSQLLEQRGNTS